MGFRWSSSNLWRGDSIGTSILITSGQNPPRRSSTGWCLSGIKVEIPANLAGTYLNLSGMVAADIPRHITSGRVSKIVILDRA